MESTIDSGQFGQLRARVEGSFSEPAMLLITSAARGDGKTATTFALAESLAEAGYRVLLVDANRHSPALSRAYRLRTVGARPDFSNITRYAAPVAAAQFSGVSLAEQRLESEMSLENVKAAAFDMRSHFDFVLVDAPPLPQSNLAVLFSMVADGTLVTLRLGRFPSSADEQTIKTLSKVGANVLGVTTVTAARIKSFAQEGKAATHAIPVPARHVTSRHSLDPEINRDVAETARPNGVS